MGRIHWVGAECIDHELISYTVGEDLIMDGILKAKHETSKANK